LVFRQFFLELLIRGKTSYTNSSVDFGMFLFFLRCVCVTDLNEKYHTLHAKKTTFMSSPQAVAGVWRRKWEEDPIGDVEGADRDTLVLWTQTPVSGLYIDLRLPKESPGGSLALARSAGYVPTPSALEARSFSVTDPSNLSSEEIDTLLRHKSFAGQLLYTLGDTTSGKALAEDDVLAQLAKDATVGALGLCTCFWRRDIDYQPPSGGLDVGVCASSPPNADGSIDLHETGADASYSEGWLRLPGSAGGPTFAFKLKSESEVERPGYWVRTGEYFAYAIGRPKDSNTAHSLGCHEGCSAVEESTGKSLREALQSIDSDLVAQLRIVGSYIGVCGKVTGNGVWNILHSTDPSLVGCTLIGSDASSCSVLSIDKGKDKLELGDVLNQYIVGCNQVIRKWEVVEIDGDINLLGI
jgi:hypothetical protein